MEFYHPKIYDLDNFSIWKNKKYFLKNGPGFTKGSRVRKMCLKCVSLGTPEPPLGKKYVFSVKILDLRDDIRWIPSSHGPAFWWCSQFLDLSLLTFEKLQQGDFGQKCFGEVKVSKLRFQHFCPESQAREAREARYGCFLIFGPPKAPPTELEMG